METYKLNNGREVLAKTTKHGQWPITYANRTQAEKKLAEMGEGWTIYHGGRPFYVVRVVP